MNINEKEYEELSWGIIKSYFEGKHLQQLIRHQIESYNNFINCQIPKTIEMFNPVTIASENDYNKDLKLYKLEIYKNSKKYKFILVKYLLC